MTQRFEATMDCESVDELAGAYALGAIDRGEAAQVAEHLRTCSRPHEELRGLIGAGDVLAAALEPVVPSPGLRNRVMATIDATPRTQAADRQMSERPISRGFGWLTPRVSRGLAAAAVVLALVFGAWNLSLQGQVANRDQALRAVAQAIAGGKDAYRVSGSGGIGYLVSAPGGAASLVVADLAPLDANRIYELWLIGADNAPVAVGSFAGSSSPVAVVQLERGLAGYLTFAVTVESQRVAAPTSAPVMLASIAKP